MSLFVTNWWSWPSSMQYHSLLGYLVVTIASIARRCRETCRMRALIIGGLKISFCQVDKSIYRY